MSESRLPAGAEESRWDSPPRPFTPRTRLFGRDSELDQLERLLAVPECRLVTITGPGGVGKTRLALALAERPAFADRSGFVELAEVEDSALIAPTILRALGLEALPGQAVEEVVVASLADRGLLLVLDNLEHLSAGRTVASLLARCAGLQILTTSRIPLGVSGEQRFPLAPFQVSGPGASLAASDAAVQLFVDRVRLVLPSFQVGPGTVEDIRSICLHLDGMPLAIELAAAHCRQLAPHALAERLRLRPLITAAGPVDAPSRQQTMQAAVTWSVNLLEPQVARFWRALGVFEGGFTLEAAEAVATAIDLPTAEVGVVLDQLETHDLVRLGTNGLGEPRYQMLRVTREVALDALQADPACAAVIEAHAAAFGRFCADAQPGLTGTEGMSWFTRVEAEMANIRATLNRDLAAGNTVRPLAMAADLHWFWTEPGYLREGLDWLTLLLDRAGEDAPAAARMAALTAASSVADWLDDQQGSLEFATQALELAREVGDRMAEMQAMLHIANTYLDLEQLTNAEPFLQQGHELARQLRDGWYLPAFSNLRAIAAAIREDWTGAAAWHRAAISGWRSSGFESHLQIAETGLAVVLVAMGDIDEGGAILRDRFAMMDRVEITTDATMALAGAAIIASEVGMPIVAVRLLAAATHLRQEMGVVFRSYFLREIERQGDVLRGQLSPPVFSRAWSEGNSRSLTAAIEEAAAFLADMPPRIALSAREREVLRLLVEGASDSEIADRLFISRHTASKHVAAILDKLGAPNRTTAVAIAYRRGLVSP